MAIVLQCTLFSILYLMPVCLVLAQTKATGAARSPLCTRDNAVDLIRQQIDLTKTFNNPTGRIKVLVRAADVLGPYQPGQARAAFLEAFELATENEKENDAKGSQALILRLRVPDQRHIVIRAVAKRDPAWAKELTSRMLKSDAPDQLASSRDRLKDELIAIRLLMSANELLPENREAAFDLARASFNYPASSALTRFLYKLAELDQTAADQFYAQAMRVYGDEPMREFLYLQAYPFAWRETLNTPIFSFYIVPPNFVPSRTLQRQFIQLLLRRAQQLLESQPDSEDLYRHSNGTILPDSAQMLHGLVLFEPQVRESLPDLLTSLIQTREKLLVSLSADIQKQFLQPGREIASKPHQTFDVRVELAQKVPDLDERDGLIVTAVFGSEKEQLSNVLQAIDKVSNSTLSAHLLEWLYFHRAITAVKEKNFDEAERLTAKVDGLEQRAYLHNEIAKGLLTVGDSETRAREVLDGAVKEAKKAGTTIFAARALLTAANLYGKIDLNQSISVLADAINWVNRIENPDFVGDDQALEKKPVRKGRGGRYQGNYLFRFYMPGLDPEALFRELAKVDFDTALSQSNSLTDKLQRVLSTIGVAEICLQQERKQTPKKRAKP